MNHAFAWLFRVAVLYFFLSSEALAFSQQAVVVPGVELRPATFVDVHLTLYTDARKACSGRTLLAVHGLAHTSQTWGPLAEALLADNPTGGRVCRVLAVELLGDSGADYPEEPPFGGVLLEDYVTLVLAVLERLPSMGLRPTSILAHSQGGLVLQMAQQRLLAQGTSLRLAHRIRHVVLVAPVPASPVSWSFADSGTGAGLLTNYVTHTEGLGEHVAVPDAAWSQLFSADLSGAVSPGAPSPDEVATQHYNRPEPLFAGMQLMGVAPFVRPTVDAGAFAWFHGTRLDIVALEQDPFLRPAELEALHAHLTATGGTRRSGRGRAVLLAGPHTTHSCYLSAPQELLEGLSGLIRLP